MVWNPVEAGILRTANDAGAPEQQSEAPRAAAGQTNGRPEGGVWEKGDRN